MGEEIYEGPNLGLGEPARRIHGVDALSLQRQLGDRVLDKALIQRLGVEEAGQIGDAQPRNRGVQKDCPSLTVSHPAVRTWRFSPEGAVSFQTAELAALE